MLQNKEDLKNKIIYRASYRGSKEMDNLLGSFTKRYINELNESELILLSDLMEVDDESLYSFKQGQNTLIKIKENKVSKLFKNFVYESE